jgi:hypothetical protein
MLRVANELGRIAGTASFEQDATRNLKGKTVAE